MRKYVFTIILAVLVILNVILLSQNHYLKSQVIAAIPQERGFLADIGGVTVDLRGAYTYPGFGAYFVPRDAEGQPLRGPLTLAIFFSAETTCPASLSETAVYQRVTQVFRDRGQSVVAVTRAKDSTAIADFLEQEQLDIPLMAWHSDSSKSLNFEQMGISPRLMPFKILYDSTLTAIYMRGADNTPQSQADFEAAMLWLSEIVANRLGE